MPEPPEADGPVLVETLAVGICGTDREIVDGEYGEAPTGDDHLVLGHESVGRVAEAPDGCGLATGDLVVGIGHRPGSELPHGHPEVDANAEIVLECTGAAALVVDVMQRNAHNAVVCLTGVSARARSLSVDVGGLNRGVVLENDVVFRSVNANRRHYEPALEHRDDDVKVVLQLGG